MWMMPLHLNVNQKSDYDDMISFSINDPVKSYREKIVLKTLQLEFNVYAISAV